MRRFIVIFLLLLLPTQVLAEALAELRAAAHPISLLESAEIAPALASAAEFSPLLATCADASNHHQAAHGDLGDSVDNVELYIHGFLSRPLWASYRPAALPSIYLPVIKPPLI